jgi:Fe2+ or Zn2+ uptake regulation protein
MAGKKRGMSLEDKRMTILNIFHESKDVMQLKEVEKLGSKRGVVLQAIKDVLQSLVDDDLVRQEKIGSSNYFWSFESDTAVKLDTDHQKLQVRLQVATAEEATLTSQLAATMQGKEETQERQQLMQSVDELDKKVAGLTNELAQYADNDPERYNAMKEACGVALDSANRWIDNIHTLRSWVKKKFQGNGGEIDAFFAENGAPEDMDYLQ